MLQITPDKSVSVLPDNKPSPYLVYACTEVFENGGGGCRGVPELYLMSPHFLHNFIPSRANNPEPPQLFITGGIGYYGVWSLFQSLPRSTSPFRIQMPFALLKV
jgi:hypothetical protein